MSKVAKRELNKYTIAYEQARRKKIEAAEWYEGSPKNPLLDFPVFTKYERNGLEIELSFTAPAADSWSAAVEKEIFEIAKANMQLLYDAAPGWSWGDAKKLTELRDPKARYVLARNKSDGQLVGFTAFRYLIEDDFDVLYLFELQLTSSVQGKGLGRFLMQLTELIARKSQMQWVMLTVLKNNKEAMAFYQKMKYEIDASSPSASDEDAGHEILSKIVDKAGIALVEARMHSIRAGLLPSDADVLLAKAPVAAGAGKAQ